MLQLLVDLQMLLPERDNFILSPDGSVQPDLRELSLVAWRCLGDLSVGEAFQERGQLPFAQLIDHQNAICTMPMGGPFLPGVLGGRRIAVTHLLEQC